MTIMDKTKVIW